MPFSPPPPPPPPRPPPPGPGRGPRQEVQPEPMPKLHRKIHLLDTTPPPSPPEFLPQGTPQTMRVICLELVILFIYISLKESIDISWTLYSTLICFDSGWENLDKPFWWGCPGAYPPKAPPGPYGGRRGVFSCSRSPPKLWGWYVSKLLILFNHYFFICFCFLISGWGNLDKPFWFGCPGAYPQKLPPAHREEEGAIFLPQGTPQTMRVICLEIINFYHLILILIHFIINVANCVVSYIVFWMGKPR